MAAFKYEFKVPGLQKNSAQVIGEVLEQLEQSEKGLTPETLLDASRSEDAVLHNEFEWNNSVAAEKYRLEQARRIIINLNAVVEKEEQVVVQSDRMFVNVDRGSNAYQRLDKVMNDEGWKALLLKQARRDAEAFIGKYRRLQELENAVNAMRELVETLKQS